VTALFTHGLRNAGSAVLLSALILGIFSCATLEQVIEEPKVTVQDVRTTSLSFSDISLELDLLIENPNPIGIELAGYDYNLLIDESSLVSGTLDRDVSLPGRGSAVLTVPVTLNYRELYSALTTLADDTESGYKIVTGLHFDLPVLGERRLELSHEGTIPLVRLPRFAFTSLYVEDLGMMGADIIVLLSLENPNGFTLSLNDFQGTFSINKLKWAELKSLGTVDLTPGEKGELGFRFRLDFLSMGRTVRDLLSGKDTLNYLFEGGVAADTSLELLKKIELPLSLSGTVDLLKPDDTTQGKHSSRKIEQSIEDNLISIFGMSP